MTNKSLNASIVVSTIFCAIVLLAPTDTLSQDLSGIKCIVNGDKNATPDASVRYREGLVYVCCEQCAEKFRAKPTAFATKANHQLVLTGQYRQAKCPISGSQVDSLYTANVGGTKIAFCCPSCLRKVSDVPEMADRAEKVFGNEAFDEAFVKVDTSPVAVDKQQIDIAEARCPVHSKRKMSVEHAVDHLDGRVFFCCQKCADAFRKSPEKHAIAANQQLAITGQYIQTGCPLIGGPVSTEHSAVVDGVPIKLCCEKCVAAINTAESTKQKVELIFEPKRFAQSFKPAFASSKEGSTKEESTKEESTKGESTQQAVDKRLR